MRVLAMLGAACAALGAVARLPAEQPGQPGRSAQPALSQPVAPAAVSAAAPRLDLRLGDLRRFVSAEDLYAPWTTDLDEVVIRPRREPPDLPERRAVPTGLGGLVWGVRNPIQSWRLFVPDPNASAAAPRSPADPQPPPGAYRTRIGEPGRIF
ncbi:MAG: hypothetical protein ACK5F5_11785 [Gammaproteobacteria bacterium]